MLFRAFLLLNVSIITNNKVNYFGLFLVESLSLLLGIGLWVIALDVWRGQGWRRKGAGALLLLLALGYGIGWVSFNIWEFIQLRDYL